MVSTPPLAIRLPRYQIETRTKEEAAMRPELWVGAAVLAVVAAVALWRFWPAPTLSRDEAAALYATPLPPPESPQQVYHLGHSLVGRDMPAMLAAMGRHAYNSQLGWGVSLKDHWTGDVRGLAEENRPPAFRPAGEAADSGAYPVVVLTEMVELKDAIRYHDSASHLALWAERFRAANPGVRLYLYETWHRRDDPAGWLSRADTDLAALWEDQVLFPAIARAGNAPIHVIPGGQALAAAVREAEAGRIPDVPGEAAFFTDEIHLSDLGAWLIAQVHFAVIYGQSPVGQPAQLPRADGPPAGAPSDAAARALQEVVWRVVTSYAATGVAQEGK